jgi:methionyl-tRNA synthetase
LNDLGQRVEGWYGGQAPDAGNWVPEHTAFLAQLGRRLDVITDALGRDGFSLRRTAAELDGIVVDARRFSLAQAGVAENELWAAEARTAIALELAAALLLAMCSAPVMPRFAAALAEALGTTDLSAWPETVELVAPGARIDLMGRTYFATAPADPAELSRV